MLTLKFPGFDPWLPLYKHDYLQTHSDNAVVLYCLHCVKVQLQLIFLNFVKNHWSCFCICLHDLWVCCWQKLMKLWTSGYLKFVCHDLVQYRSEIDYTTHMYMAYIWFCVCVYFCECVCVCVWSWCLLIGNKPGTQLKRLTRRSFLKWEIRF